jgi:hypothetical protein
MESMHMQCNVFLCDGEQLRYARCTVYALD